MNIESRPWTLQDLLDNLQKMIVEEPDDYCNERRWTLCTARGYLKQYLMQPDEPLTLEQLREMIGEPVYDYLGQEWYVIQEYYDHEFLMTDGTRFEDGDEVDRVNERFYRRPPEGK